MKISNSVNYASSNRPTPDSKQPKIEKCYCSAYTVRPLTYGFHFRNFSYLLSQPQSMVSDGLRLLVYLLLKEHRCIGMPYDFYYLIKHVWGSSTRQVDLLFHPLLTQSRIKVKLHICCINSKSSPSCMCKGAINNAWCRPTWISTLYLVASGRLLH